MEFIARNVAWWGPSRLAPKEIADLGEPREVLVMFPASTQFLQADKLSQQKDRLVDHIPHISSAILFLYPGRMRILKDDQSGRVLAKTGLWYPRVKSYVFNEEKQEQTKAT